ncbi:MAG: DUF2953 domain-containing protein [Oscillospiraceae bacterium]|nr:DUF2953 domain-containing protein [Oscillospiraceae bacterium]
MGWLITFGILFLLAVLPLGAAIRYDSGGIRVRLVLGPVKCTVYPRPKKEKKDKKEPGTNRETKKQEPEKKDKSLPKPPQPPKEEKPAGGQKGGPLTDFLPLVKVALDFLGDFRRKLRLDDLYLRLILASGDPCDLAVNYGRTWAAVGNLLPVLEQCFVIRKKDVEVECDFTASQTTVIARLEITITLGRLLALLAVYGFRGIKEFISIRNKRKGGAAK